VKKQKKSILEKEISLAGVNLTTKALFARHIAVMLAAGMPITEALLVTIDAARGKMKRVLEKVYTAVDAGRTLSSALADHQAVFSGLFIHATRAGEASGTLEENLENVADQLEKEKELVDKVRGAMLYPVVVLTAAFFLGLALAFFILPKITPLFAGLDIELPFTTRGLIWMSGLIEQHGGIIFILIIAAAALFLWTIRQRWSYIVTHKILLLTPIIRNITRGSNLARFCRTFGTLLKSGLNIDEALSITAETMGNMYYQRSLGHAAEQVGKGGKLSAYLSRDESLFPVMVTRMVKVGEESGALDETLLHLAEFYETEVDTATKSLSTVIEPILLLFIGIVVAFLALSIITPIYNITGSVSG
jgi:type IV pilus assembly protein PilC